MKKIISKLMGGVLLFSLSMSLTSCEGALDDILGEWSRPTPGNKDVMVKELVNLSAITEDYTAQDGTVLTGTLASEVKISIADGATVTLKDVTINGTNVDDDAHKHAGITCLGDATINLEGTNNKVKGFGASYPGIYVPVNKTLIIQGSGSLDASSGMDSYAHEFGAGIGGGESGSCGDITIKGGNITATGGCSGGAGIGSGYNQGTCGNITITGGTITAKGGYYAAGIGGGYAASCDAITISGGTVEATGGEGAAGIGSGKTYYEDVASCGTISISGGTITATGGKEAAGIGGGYKNGTCGTITITSGVTSVTATKGNSAPNSIGKGYESTNAISVKIGDDMYASGITTSPYTYPAP